MNRTDVFDGKCSCLLHEDLEAYDALPRAVRQALAHAPYNIAAIPIQAAIYERGVSPLHILDEITVAVRRAQREKALVPNDP